MESYTLGNTTDLNLLELADPSKTTNIQHVKQSDSEDTFLVDRDNDDEPNNKNDANNSRNSSRHNDDSEDSRSDMSSERSSKSSGRNNEPRNVPNSAKFEPPLFGSGIPQAVPLNNNIPTFSNNNQNRENRDIKDNPILKRIEEEENRRKLKFKRHEVFDALMDLKNNKKITLTREYSFNDNLEDMEDELEYHRYIKSKENKLKMAKKGFLYAAFGLEWLNTKDPFGFGLQLDGYHEAMKEDVDDFDEVFKQLIDKYSPHSTRSHPEMQFLLMFCASVAFHHAQNSKSEGLMGTAMKMGSGVAKEQFFSKMKGENDREKKEKMLNILKEKKKKKEQEQMKKQEKKTNNNEAQVSNTELLRGIKSGLKNKDSSSITMTETTNK